MSADLDPYVYPGTTVLRNKLGLTDAASLAGAEYRLTLTRRRELEEAPVAGRFDLAHLQAIHAHLFQDVFEWAGELRRVDISKGTSRFHDRTRFQQAAEVIFAALHAGPLLSGGPLAEREFVIHAANLLEQVNYLHPFREGNGRTQRAFLDQVAAVSGRSLCWRNVTNDVHLAACVAAFEAADGEPLRPVIEASLRPARDGLSVRDEGAYAILPPGVSPSDRYPR